MLLTKEVEYKVNGRSLSYYRNLGYRCNVGDIITVDVNDLKNYSTPLVEYQCDKCGEVIKIKFREFSHHHKINDKTYCVKCANENIFEKRRNDNEKFIAKDGFKLCRQCERKLPANSDYFFAKTSLIDGFDGRCKECCGREFTNHLTAPKPKDGYKFCLKCGRELPANKMYYPTDNSCKTGIRNVCRECDKKYGKFLDKMPEPSEPWSKSDLELLRSVYADYTNEELVKKFFPNRTKRALDTQADMHGFNCKSAETYKRSCIIRGQKCSEKLKGRKMSDEVKERQSKRLKEYYKTHDGFAKGRKMSDEQKQMISLRMKGKWSGKKNPRYKNPFKGKDNPNWKGGITALYQELRSDTKDWFNESAKFCNYNCVITGINFDNIHHLVAFKDIVKETFDIVKLDFKENISGYSQTEEENIRNTLKLLHDKYGLGACINKDVHKLFHDTYGYSKFTRENFINFVNRIENGEFNEWFNEHILPIKINYDYINYSNKIGGDSYAAKET